MKIKSELLSTHLKESISWLQKQIQIKPTVAIILGSGLGGFANQLKNKIVISTSDVPNYPSLTVEGHKGKLVVGKVGKVNVLAFQGRVHFYEVGDLYKVLFPIYIAYGLGAKILFVTNAAGGINRHFQPGDLMIITDQMNLTFENSLRNVPEVKVKTSSRLTYDVKIQSLIEQVAAEKGIPIHRGIYCGVKGPSYETAAEVEMIRRLGADAVGMSTVNEVSLAVALGTKVGGISCITNLATGIAKIPLSHSEVTVVANKVKKRFEKLLKGVISRL